MATPQDTQNESLAEDPAQSDPTMGGADDTVTITMPKQVAQQLSDAVGQLAQLLQGAMGKVENDITGQKAELAKQGEAVPAGINYDELASEMNNATNARRGFGTK